MMKQYLVFCIPALLVGLSLGENIHNYWHGLGFKSFGNLADWAMVGVTAVTLYFLYQQFEEMRKQTAALVMQQYQNEMRDCLMQIITLFKSISSEDDTWSLKYIYNADTQGTKLKERLFKPHNHLGGVSVLRDIVKHRNFDFIMMNEERFEIVELSNRLRRLYRKLKNIDRQNDLQGLLYDDCNSFAEEFLKRLEEFEQSSSPAVTPAQAGI